MNEAAMTPATLTGCVDTAFIGIGNTLAGDDGAGIVAIGRLRSALSEKERKTYLFSVITGDLFTVTDYLEKARRFIFLDAVTGKLTGELRIIRHEGPHLPFGSFHQTDICTVMESLRSIGYTDPFPPWEVRGIAISPPDRLHEGLSPAINLAVDRLVSGIVDEIRCGSL